MGPESISVDARDSRLNWLGRRPGGVARQDGDGRTASLPTQGADGGGLRARALPALVAGLDTLRSLVAATCLTLAGVGAALAASSPPTPLPPQPGWTLQGVVIFSRHGMRGSLIPVRCGADEKGCLATQSRDPWPDLGVAAGHLTAPGYSRVVSMGAYYRRLYAAAGLLPARGCLDPASVAFTADSVERTILTAGAVMDGMAPGCGLPQLDVDATVYAGPACGFDKAAAAKASQALVGGSWAAVAETELARSIAVMSRTLGPLPDASCSAQGLAAGCELSDIRASEDDPGPIAFVDQSSEQFVMQYGGGASGEAVGWGRLADAAGAPLAEAVTQVTAAHALYDRSLQMPRYQAAKLGSQSLALVREQLDQIAAGQGPRFRFFASHDNYILNLGGLLGLSWHLQSYNPFQVPPGGSVAFELWRDGDAADHIRLVYRAQTLDQLHENSVLDLDRPPAENVMIPAGCDDATGGACPLPRFKLLVEAALEPACLAH